MPIVIANPAGISNPWNISGATQDLCFDLSSEEGSPFGMAFSTDGTKMYMSGEVQETVFQYTLSTPWNLSSASDSGLSKVVTSQDGSPYQLSFSSDGTKMFVFGSGNNTVYQYTLSTAWNVSSANWDGVSFSWLATGQDLDPSGMSFKSDGTKLYLVGNFSDAIYQYTLSTPWSLGSVVYDSVSFSTTGEDFTPVDVQFSSDGLKMFLVGGGNDDIFQYTLGTAWVVSSAVYDNEAFATGDTNPRSVGFKSDGTKMYVLGGTGVEVCQYSL